MTFDLDSRLRPSIAARVRHRPSFDPPDTGTLCEAHAYGELTAIHLPAVVLKLEGALRYAAGRDPEKSSGHLPTPDDVWNYMDHQSWRHAKPYSDLFPTNIALERKESLPRPTDLRDWWYAIRPYLPPLLEPELTIRDRR